MGVYFGVIRDVDINDCKEVSDLVGVYEVWIHAVYFNFSPISFCYVNGANLFF